jgi:Rap guanine nucleotide exchange factor 4
MMMGKVLKTLIMAASSASPASALIRDRKVPGRGTVRHCLVGTEMVDWLLGLSPEVHSRAQASAMWQVLLDEQVILARNEVYFLSFIFLNKFINDLSIRFVFFFASIN